MSETRPLRRDATRNTAAGWQPWIGRHEHSLPVGPTNIGAAEKIFFRQPIREGLYGPQPSSARRPEPPLCHVVNRAPDPLRLPGSGHACRSSWSGHPSAPTRAARYGTWPAWRSPAGEPPPSPPAETPTDRDDPDPARGARSGHHHNVDALAPDGSIEFGASCSSAESTVRSPYSQYRAGSTTMLSAVAEIRPPRITMAIGV